MAENKPLQQLANAQVTPSVLRVALTQLVKYGGLKALGAIVASRKGVFGLLAIVIGYYFLLGRLPDDAPPEVVTGMGEIFGVLVGAISAFFIGGTALEDGMAKRANAPTGGNAPK